jgi:hypothetical protein
MLMGPDSRASSGGPSYATAAAIALVAWLGWATPAQGAPTVPRIQDVQTVDELVASQAVVESVQGVTTSAFERSLESVRSKIADQRKEPAVHILHVARLDQVSAIKDQVDAARVLLGAKTNSRFVFIAPATIAARVAELLPGENVLPFDNDGDGEALLAKISELTHQTQTGEIFDFLVDPVLQEQLRRTLTETPGRRVQFRLINTGDPYAWARAIVEFYLGDRTNGVFAEMQRTAVGPSLIRQLLILKQA